MAKEVKIGKIAIGGENPVAIQSMISVPSTDIEGSVNQAVLLEKAGCEILRAAIPDMAAVELIPAIKDKIDIPLVADIHFDYRLALAAVENGIDMFDCVLPSRNARNGSYFTRDGSIAIKNARFAEDFLPIDPECNCKVCRQYSRAYLRHLFKEQEILSSMLATYHNLAFLHQMMEEVREAISQDRFAEYKRNFLARYNANKKG